MKNLLLLLSFLIVLMSCEKNAEDMAANDSPANISSKGENDNNPDGSASSKDIGSTTKPTDYYFAGYQTSKTQGSEKLGMNVIKTAPDNANLLQISGSSFVNLYGATYTYSQANGNIKNTELMTTEMAGPAEAMKAEDEFYQNLAKATKIIFEEKQIKLLVGEPVKEVLIFKKR